MESLPARAAEGAPPALPHVEVVRRVLQSRLLSPEQLLVATRHSREQQTGLREALVDLQLLTPEQLEEILATPPAPAPDPDGEPPVEGLAAGDDASPGLPAVPVAPQTFESDLRAELRQVAASAVSSDLLQQLIFRAYTSRASDIHLDPRNGRYVVRYRVDGQLHDMVDLTVETGQAIIRGIKIAAELNITERRHPQDGSIDFSDEGRNRSIRVSTLPLNNGEKVALRILEPRAQTLGLDHLGLDPDQLEMLGQFLAQPYGAILVGGPVGSGKTTTLYSCMDRLNISSRNLMSIEDPVERLLDGVNQAAVDTRTGISFSDGLRAVLRQDPDILMIGEIRDEETASIGIRASLTGILVLSTVHASDAASVVGTLFNYGIPGYTLATALKGIMSQRLLRRICSKCRVSYRPDAKILRALGLDPDEHAGTILHRGRGCVECFNTGYRGRVGIYEVLPVTDLIPDLILRQTTSEVIRQVARDEGMKTLRQSAMAKVLEGATTVEEMYRVSF